MLPQAVRQELKLMITMAWPVAISFTLEQLLLVVVAIFTGHLGKVQLDATGLGNTIMDIGGYAVASGVNTACDTLFSQTYGSKNKRNLGVLLQRAILINFLMCVACCPLFINVRAILWLLGQDPQVTRLAGIFSDTFTAALPGLALLMVLSKYLFAQNIVLPSFVILGLSNVVNAILLYIFLHWGYLDMLGAGMAVCLSYWSGSLMHIIYIYGFNVYKQTWSGWSVACLREWKLFFSLALPGLLMVCLPWSGLEVFSVTAGLLGTVELAAHTLLVLVVATADMLMYGVGVAASMRVGNLLGSGDHTGARQAAYVVISLAASLSSLVASVLLILREPLMTSFTTNLDVRQLSITLSPAIALYHIFSAVSSVTGGVLRGMGRQKFGAVACIIGVYVIALPVGIPLMYKTNLRLAGCWIGMLAGRAIEGIANLILIRCVDWKKEAIRADNRTRTHVYEQNGNYKEYQPIVREDSSSDSEDDTDRRCPNDNMEYTNNSNTARTILSRLLALFVVLAVLAAGVIVRTKFEPDVIGALPERNNCSLMALTFNITCDKNISKQ